MYTTGRDFAIIHKTSINYDESSYFSSPFFVFTEKVGYIIIYKNSNIFINYSILFINSKLDTYKINL